MKKLIIALLFIPGASFGAELCITIPEPVKDRVILAVSSEYNYRDTILDQNGDPIPNPQTRAQFSRDVVRKFIKDVVIRYESKKASNDAYDQAVDDANSDIDIQ